MLAELWTPAEALTPKRVVQTLFRGGCRRTAHTAAAIWRQWDLYPTHLFDDVEDSDLQAR